MSERFARKKAPVGGGATSAPHAKREGD